MTEKIRQAKIIKFQNRKKLCELLGNKCVNCGEDNFFKLAFHHREPKDKKFKICDRIDRSYSSLIEEALKCDLLCENCHAEHHYLLSKETWSKESKKFIINISTKNCCENCGYNKSISALCFHHLHDKKFNIGSLGRINSLIRIKDKIEEEINKCVLLCRNCHILEHTDYEFYKINLNEIINYKKRRNCGRVDKNKVFELYNQGFTQSMISRELNCGKSTICGIIKNGNVDQGRARS